MNANEKRLAETLLPCPHCGKAPVVTVASHEDDEAAKWLDVSFIRQIRLGRPYCCIECCTVLEGNEGLDEMAATWNRRTPATGESLLDVALLSIKGEIAELKELIADTPEGRIMECKSLEARLSEVRKEALETLRRMARSKLERRKAADALKPKKPIPEPRYDDVYYEGLAWLNGEPLPEEEILLELAEMDKSFNAAREKVRESIERGPRRMSRAPDI